MQVYKENRGFVTSQSNSSAKKYEEMREGASIESEAEDYFFDDEESEENLSLQNDEKIGSNCTRQASSISDIELVSKKSGTPARYTYEILDFVQAKVLYISKFVILKNKFDYLCFSDGFFKDALSKYRFQVDKASQYISDKAEDLVGHPDHSFQQIDQKQDHTCNILWDTMPGNQMAHFGCGHMVEKECMKEYMTDQILRIGPECVNISCPNDTCSVKSSHLHIEQLCDPGVQEVYYKHLIADFCQNAPYIVPCMGADCEYFFSISEKVMDKSGKPPSQSAACHCGWLTCLRCRKRGHEPLNCDSYEEWIDKVEAIKDDLNSNWVKKNTKKCTKCKTDIQKNEGCMHMTCKLCQNQFCWLCLGDWKEHNEKTGGFFACNRFNSDKAKDPENIDIERFQFYMDRYMEHDRSFHISQKTLHHWTEQLQSDSTIGKLNIKSGQELRFYIDCLKSAIVSRNFITYTYSLGYKIQNQRQLDLFSINQYMLEQALEKLDKYLDDHKPSTLIDDKDACCIKFVPNMIKYKSAALELRLALEKQFANAKHEFSNERFLIDILLKDDPIENDVHNSRSTVFIKKLRNAGKTSSLREPQNWSCRHCSFYNEGNSNKICVTCGLMGKPK